MVVVVGGAAAALFVAAADLGTVCFFFLGLAVLVVITVDAGSVWDIAFFDPKRGLLRFFLVFGTSPTR